MEPPAPEVSGALEALEEDMPPAPASPARSALAEAGLPPLGDDPHSPASPADEFFTPALEAERVVDEEEEPVDEEEVTTTS